MVLALAGGVLIALSVPPAGWWPLGIAGVALLGHLLAGRRARARALIGLSGGLGLYGITLAWMSEFNLVGGVLVVLLESSFLTLAALATPPRRGRQAGWVGALMLQDWLRGGIPFGGVPMGGIALGQAAGPLAPAARLGGGLLVTGLVAAGAVTLETLVTAAVGRPRRQRARPGTGGRVRWAAAMFPIAVVALPLVGQAAPSGRDVAPMRVAAVQGGGRRGVRAIHSSPEAVFDAALAATRQVRPPVDLILWPEDVIALDGPVAGTTIAQEVGAVAATNQAALLAGVTEDVGADRFRNAEVVWDGTGQITGRYDKVHRVPFGEYVPGRSFVSHLVSLAVIPRDAISGTGTGEIRTQAGPVGVAISFEVYFSDRTRSAIRAGGQVLLVPTNTASYTTTQVPSSEIASAQLRAWETGRDVVMAAPTGFSAVVDRRGRLVARSHIGRPEVLRAVVQRRTGDTPYVVWGDVPVLVTAGALMAAAWALASLDRTVNPRQP